MTIETYFHSTQVSLQQVRKNEVTSINNSYYIKQGYCYALLTIQTQKHWNSNTYCLLDLESGTWWNPRLVYGRSDPQRYFQLNSHRWLLKHLTRGQLKILCKALSLTWQNRYITLSYSGTALVINKNVLINSLMLAITLLSLI